MKVSEYAKEMNITRQGAYWRIKHGLVEAYTRCGHWVIDQDQVDYAEMERKADEAFVMVLMGHVFGGRTQGDENEQA